MNIDKDGTIHQPNRKWYSFRETREIYAKGGKVVLTSHEKNPRPDESPWLETVRTGLQRIVDLKNPMPRAAVREAVAELLSALPPKTPK